MKPRGSLIVDSMPPLESMYSLISTVKVKSSLLLLLLICFEILNPPDFSYSLTSLIMDIEVVKYCINNPLMMLNHIYEVSSYTLIGSPFSN